VTYHGEVERIAAAVEAGADLYEQVAVSDYVTDPEWFGAVMRSTRHADEFAIIFDQDMKPDEWFAATGHVVFFAMCADVRERLHA
jgi:hypothetical protein